MSTDASDYLQGVLTLPENVIKMTVLGMVRKQLQDRQAEYHSYLLACHEEGRAPMRCIHGTQVVWEDDRDCACGQCEASMNLAEEADAITGDFVWSFMQAKGKFESVLNIAADSGLDVQFWYPFVSAMANKAVDLIAPVWPVVPRRWHPIPTSV